MRASILAYKFYIRMFLMHYAEKVRVDLHRRKLHCVKQPVLALHRVELGRTRTFQICMRQ